MDIRDIVDEIFDRPMVVMIPKFKDKKVGEYIDTLLKDLNGIVLVITRIDVSKIGAFSKKMKKMKEPWWFVGIARDEYKDITKRLKDVIDGILKYGSPKP